MKTEIPIKAIETVWKGYRFRSRLEARWAVFFEALGVQWVYESEGFTLKSGNYLPDFSLPQAHCYVEIKPNVSISRASRICGELARRTCTRVLLIQGEPWPTEYWMLVFDDQGIAYNNIVFGACSKCFEEICLVSCEYQSTLTAKSACRHENHPVADRDVIAHWNEHHLLAQAFRAARGARFEHGETPNTFQQVSVEHQ